MQKQPRTRHRLRPLILAAAPAALAALVWTAGPLGPSARADEKPDGAAVEAKEVKADEADEADEDAAPAAGAEKAGPKAEVSESAQKELDQLRDAYKNAAALDLSGTVSVDFDIDGQKMNNNAKFSSTFQAPNKFRHESDQDMLVGSTGEKVYAYRKAQNDYLTADAPKADAASRELPQPFGQILQQQNPALVFALSADPAAKLIENATKVEKVEDVKIGDKAFTALELSNAENADVRVLIDPETHLVRQVVIDMKKSMEARGQQNVNKAAFTVDYTGVKLGDAAGVKDEQFAWAPPEGARDARAAADDEGGGGALQGQPAPAFTLDGLDGKKVSPLEAHKGKVMVFDFWATWCGPCVRGLPHLQKIYEANKEKGLFVYAVNQDEDKATVQKFVDAKKLTVPVLMDPGSATGGKYGVEGIPHTVVVGKDGKISAVVVGFGGEDDHRLSDAVKEAMAVKE